MILKTLKQAAQALMSHRTAAITEYPLEVEQALAQQHSKAPVQTHLDSLYHDITIGTERFSDLYRRCLERTGTLVTPFNVFQRFQTRLDIVQYFLATLALPGGRAECGVYRGATALLLCHARRMRDPSYQGENFYLIDSYSGTSASTQADYIPVRAQDGSTRMEAFFPAGKTDVSPAIVREYFLEYPQAQICAGWIPGVFATLPEQLWAFVHLDVTLYEPTLAALEYFHPRMTQGGVIVCDGSIFCPGAARAWENFCESRALAYVTLGHRETALIK
jgi:hypothetical protein